MEKFIFGVFLTFITVTSGQHEIKIDCGRLVAQGYNYCEIEHDNEIITYKGPVRKVFLNLRFGLISYKCDHTAGYFMSEIDCKKCNFKCADEELAEIEACRSDPAQFWCGLMVGLLFSFVIAAFIFKYLHSILSLFAVTRWEDQDSGKKARTPSSESTWRKTTFSTIGGLLLFRSTEACDISVAIHGNNITTFCEASVNVCRTPPSSMDVRKGFEICIGNHFGEQASIQVSGIDWRVRYQLAYYTPDYTVNFNFMSYCCEWRGTYESCSGNITSMPCHKQAIKKFKETYSTNETIDAKCYYTTLREVIKCLYTNEINRKGDLYGILKKTGASATVKLTVNYSNSSEVLSLNDFDPTFFLKLTKFKHSPVTVPITVLGLPFQDPIYIVHRVHEKLPYSPRSLLHHDGNLYWVDSADTRRLPEDDIFGDFQVSLKNETMMKPTGVACEKENDCKCQCNAKKTSSKISDFERRKNDFQQPSSYIVREADFSVIDAFEPSQSDYVSLRLGVWSVNDFERMEGQCDIELLGSYGCTSCDERTYVVLKATKVDRLGLVPFYTNCSSDRVSVKCDSEPTRLIIEGKPNACHFRLPTMKKQFTVELKYSQLGHQVQPRKQLNCTATFTGYGEAMRHLVTSPTFIKTSVGTVLLFLVSCSLLLVIIVMRLRKNRELPHTVQSTDDLLEL